MKDFLSITDFSAEQLTEMLEESSELKKLYKGGNRDLSLAGKVLIMLFEKPSLRTRISFAVAMSDLGGSSIYVKPEDIGGIGKREPIKDMARVLSSYADGIMARTFEHSTVTEVAAFATVPVINGLTDWSHPCQAMADVLTIQEHCGRIEGVKIAYVGDGNNVARSLAFACGKLNAKMTVATPAGYELDAIAAVVIGGTSLAGGRGGMMLTLMGALIIGYINILFLDACDDLTRSFVSVKSSEKPASKGESMLKRQWSSRTVALTSFTSVRIKRSSERQST